MLSLIKNKFWKWPNGFIWKITEKATLRSRRKRYDFFISKMKPGPEDEILDVGVAPYFLRGTNFLEQWYSHPHRITALTNDNPERFNDFNKKFPEVKLLFSDGKKLEFSDNCFDVVFSNAVIEHVGGREDQRRFIQEIIRVGKRAFITTPNYRFPLEAHTLIPFAHWFPLKIRFWIYKKLGRGYWADVNHLNLLTERSFLSLFPVGIKVKVYKQRILGIASNLIAVAEK
ncbi:MAG: methyltransferase domain-containing protein [Candidatus Omnitrophota bacterium]|jgi:SAM-dependent methyltransferase